MVLEWKYQYWKNKWPIPAENFHRPNPWKGWPGGKKFALVLTHDVETQRGQDRCFALMKIEEELGFVSSFNFVPERYEVSPVIRNELVRKGFEVAVHDLKHDGKLYSSHNKFLKCAERINGYLKAWDAVGFRAGAMHDNRGWNHVLDVEYIASTFDFDPFEPQPDGVSTIFPFWVREEGTGRGYVSLPYTLAQDFTLFVLLRKKNINIWKEKLDWIASHGGMVLLITHPDYISFDGGKPRFDEYPIERYLDLLEYVKTGYPGQYWNALPREVALYYKNMMNITNLVQRAG
jgi:hypothetical protein